MEIISDDRATIARIMAMGTDYGPSRLAQISRQITVRRLATIRTRWGRKHTGTLVDKPGLFWTGWVTTPRGRHPYGRVIATHGSVWPDGTQSGPEEFNKSGQVPYEPPPEGWVYVP